MEQFFVGTWRKLRPECALLLLEPTTHWVERSFRKETDDSGRGSDLRAAFYEKHSEMFYRSRYFQLQINPFLSEDAAADTSYPNLAKYCKIVKQKAWERALRSKTADVS